MAARWYGFEHPHEDVTYQFAIGTNAGDVDVTGGFVGVGSVSEHTAEGLSLSLQQVGLYKFSKATVCEWFFFHKKMSTE